MTSKPTAREQFEKIKDTEYYRDISPSFDMLFKDALFLKALVEAYRDVAKELLVPGYDYERIDSIVNQRVAEGAGKV